MRRLLVEDKPISASGTTGVAASALTRVGKVDGAAIDVLTFEPGAGLTLAGDPRWARGRLRLPLSERRLADEEGRLLPAVRDEAVLIPPWPWSLVSCGYLQAPHAEPRGASSYALMAA